MRFISAASLRAIIINDIFLITASRFIALDIAAAAMAIALALPRLLGHYF